jgi:hypothetical protein
MAHYLLVVEAVGYITEVYNRANLPVKKYLLLNYLDYEFFWFVLIGVLPLITFAGLIILQGKLNLLSE